MKYVLMIYGNESKFDAMSSGQREELMSAYGAYGEALRKAGIMVGGDRLQRSSAATAVRVADGKTQVLDGPYADTKEQLGGFLVIDVPDLDAALAWAARCPGATHGTVEVRPIWPSADPCPMSYQPVAQSVG
ncbi:YciI family protein [Aquabacter sp. CN5-332]|uniref:YciI family protein n=1 Tax=Aquabacter sp. CN5-332 TaxID=3156608 RepID=UPI0032B52878